jgi:hypothetical protein
MIPSFVKIFAIGTDYIKDIFEEQVEVSEKIDGCVSIDEEVLTSDLRYVKAGELKVGDKLIGFDEILNDARFREATVTVATPIIKCCYKIKFSNNKEIIASSDHPWVVRFPNKTPIHKLTKDYITTENLKVGMKIVDFGYWQKDISWDSGYIAGQYDGEGSLTGRGESHNAIRLTYYQKDGDEVRFIYEYLLKNGFKVYMDERQRKIHYKWIVTLMISGGWVEVLRFLGLFRPKRLLKKAKEKIWLNAKMHGVKASSEVKEIIYIGKQKVMGLSTDIKTYIVKGLLCHNSQIAFGLINNMLHIRSKGSKLYQDNPEKMFKEGIDYIASIQGLLPEGIVFYGEYLKKPKHNTLVYSRVPRNHIILFGAKSFGKDLYLPNFQEYAEVLNLEVVPVARVNITSPDDLKAFMDLDSVLGGTKREGVVVKNYGRKFLLGGQPMPMMCGKFVSEQFKEVHKNRWGKEETGKGRFETFCESFHTEARWQKAVQHLAEKGELENSPRDIGKLMKEINIDIEEEEKADVMEYLWNEYKRDIFRAATRGAAEWYKTQLLNRSFSKEESTTD